MNSTRVRALSLCTLLLVGCAGRPDERGAAPVRSATPLPPGWGRLAPLLADAERLAAAGEVARLRALAPTINTEGSSLLKAKVPNVLSRHEVPRFLEGRALFGEHLVNFAAEAESGLDAELPALLQRLSEAYHAWMAVIQGLPPERAV